MRLASFAAALLVLGAACGSSSPGGCIYPGSSGTATVTFNGAGFNSPACWETSGLAGQGGLLVSDNVDFATANLSLSVLLYANQDNQPSEAACRWQTGTTVPLTSPCLGVTATGTNTFIALGGYPALGGTVTPTGSLTVNAWPAAASDTLSVTFSPDAQLLYVPALDGAAGDAGLLPVSGTLTGTSLGPVTPGDITSN